MIGMIIPPAQIKERAEKTAEYVANNGEEFESLVYQQEQSNPKFIFLHKDNPYRPFYDYMVNEYRKKLLEAQKTKEEVVVDAVPEPADMEAVDAGDAFKEEFNPIQAQQREFLEHAFEGFKTPDPEQFYVDVPEKLTLADKEIIQHTAQYVARNGRNFLMPLSDREKNNPQFQFLKPGSDNFKYFTSLVDGYTRLINLTSDEVKRLDTMATEREYILSKCMEKFQFEKRQNQSKAKKAQDDKNKDTNVDWNDFELVETIAFDDDNLIKDSASVRNELEVFMGRRTVHDMHMPEKPVQEIITTKKKELLQQCAVCGRHFPVSGMSNHLSLCMLDPKVKEKRRLAQARQQQPSGGLDIAENLKQLQQKRPDIFGSKQGTFQLQQQLPQQGDGKPAAKLIWDGQAANMTRTTATIAMMQNQQKKLLEQMREANKKKS